MNPDEILPFVLGGIVLMIPIVAILTSHQQRMAQILHGKKDVDLDIQRELHELRQVVHQQAIAIDNLTQMQLQMAKRLEGVEPLVQRLSQSS